MEGAAAVSGLMSAKGCKGKKTKEAKKRDGANTKLARNSRGVLHKPEPRFTCFWLAVCARLQQRFAKEGVGEFAKPQRGAK